jgi:hypothetical protein
MTQLIIVASARRRQNPRADATDFRRAAGVLNGRPLASRVVKNVPHGASALQGASALHSALGCALSHTTRSRSRAKRQQQPCFSSLSGPQPYFAVVFFFGTSVA